VSRCDPRRSVRHETTPWPGGVEGFRPLHKFTTLVGAGAQTGNEMTRRPHPVTVHAVRNVAIYLLNAY
jgi:hypothetical protein